MSQLPLKNQLFAEFFGTAALLCAVIGSGIMAVNLSGGNNAVALLANTLATVFALCVLIEVLGPISGAHFNPVVTLAKVFCAFREPKKAVAQPLQAMSAILFIAAQLLGAVAGAWLAHAMFELPVWQLSSKVRAGWGQYLAEGVATAGLMVVVLRAPADKAASLVACFIGAAYWFTASTSFANPAAVLGRMLSDSFAGIAPASAPGFVLSQIAGAAIGAGLDRLLGRPADRPD